MRITSFGAGNSACTEEYQTWFRLGLNLLSGLSSALTLLAPRDGLKVYGVM